MENRTRLSKLRSLVNDGLGWLPPALTRVSLGLLFLTTGWAKVHHFQKVIEYFASLGIPFPGLNAHVVAFVELICGGLLLLGLLTRLASIPLTISMIVAVITAKASDISAPSDLFGTSEYLYILLLIWLMIRGPGELSLDRWFSRKSGR